MKLKKSEARILIYLNQVPLPDRYLMRMSSKLNMEYGYLIKIVNMMKERLLLEKRQSFSHCNNKSFYVLTQEGVNLLPEANMIVIRGGKKHDQTKL